MVEKHDWCGVYTNTLWRRAANKIQIAVMVISVVRGCGRLRLSINNLFTM